MHITYKIRVSKGDLQLRECQIAQNRDYFCDFGRKLENLSLPVHAPCFAAMDETK